MTDKINAGPGARTEEFLLYQKGARLILNLYP